MITRINSFHRKTYVSQTLEAEIGENKNTTNYVPLQTREHAWAGMSGMPHSVGLEGHLRPEALNLEAWNHMLRDLFT